jgi:hypothetical protein
VFGGTGRSTGHRRRRWVLAASCFVALVAAACSTGSSSTDVVTIRAGQAAPGELPTGAAVRAAQHATAATVPLAQQNPTTALFTAIGVFQSCLSNLGVTFIGAPDPSNPSSPANNPGYLKNLGTCATKANILQALKAAQSAQDNLTPAQVKKENKQYLQWRKCMIGRGWGIPQPAPNAKGLLFSFGGTGGGGGGGAGGFKPPPGQSLFNSSDLQQCAAVAQQHA